MSIESDGLQVRTLRANGTIIDTSDTPPALGIAFSTEVNNPLEISGTGTDAGLSLNIDADGPLQKTSNGLDVVLESNGGLGIGSLSSGIEVLTPSTNSGLQKGSSGLSVNISASGGLNYDVSGGIHILTDPLISGPLSISSEGLKWEAGIGALNDVTLGTLADGQILSYNGTNWLNTTLSGNHSFTAGTGLSFNADGTVLNTDGNMIEYSSVGVDATDTAPVLNTGTTREIIIGGNNIIGGASAIAIGTSTQALATSSVAIGLSARADALTTTAVGGGSRAFLENATALGRSASANGASSTAVGSNAATTATDATAIGTDSTAGGVRSIAMGQASNASGTNTVCIGNSSTSSGTNSVNIGSATNGTGARAVAIGSAAVTGSNALGIAIGERATVGAQRGIAIGSSSQSDLPTADLCRADGGNSIAIGRAARSDGASGIAIGDDTRALTTSTIAIGDGAQVTSAGTASTAIGSGATATLPNSTVLGTGATHRLFVGSREVDLTPPATGTITWGTDTLTLSSRKSNTPVTIPVGTSEYSIKDGICTMQISWLIGGTTAMVPDMKALYTMDSATSAILLPNSDPAVRPIGHFTVYQSSGGFGNNNSRFAAGSIIRASAGRIGFIVDSISTTTGPNFNQVIYANCTYRL